MNRPDTTTSAAPLPVPLPLALGLLLLSILLLAPPPAAGAEMGTEEEPEAAEMGTADEPEVGAEVGTADERAAEVAARVMEALGGEEAWDETRFISFGFAGRRMHWWDRQTGRHRVEGTTQDGEPWLVLHDVDSREGPDQGQAWVDGSEVTGERAAELLENAYGAWINDTYWLLAPYKLRDPGVNLAYESEATLDGGTYDVLALSFEAVGLTPGDRYWIYVDRESGLVHRWEYVLEHQPPDSTPTAWNWEGWQRYGEIMLAPLREQPREDRLLDLSPIAVHDSLPDSVFSSPDPVAAGGEERGEEGDGEAEG